MVDLETLLGGPRLGLSLQVMGQTCRGQDGRVTGAWVAAQLHELHVAQVRRRMIVAVSQQRRFLQSRHLCNKEQRPKPLGPFSPANALLFILSFAPYARSPLFSSLFSRARPYKRRFYSLFRGNASFSALASNCFTLVTFFFLN